MAFDKPDGFFLYWPLLVITVVVYGSYLKESLKKTGYGDTFATLFLDMVVGALLLLVGVYYYFSERIFRFVKYVGDGNHHAVCLTAAGKVGLYFITVGELHTLKAIVFAGFMIILISAMLTEDAFFKDIVKEVIGIAVTLAIQAYGRRYVLIFWSDLGLLVVTTLVYHLRPKYAFQEREEGDVSLHSIREDH